MGQAAVQLLDFIAPFNQFFTDHSDLIHGSRVITTVIALRWSLTPFREVLASEAVLLRRSGKIRSTELFSFQGTVKWSD